MNRLCIRRGTTPVITFSIPVSAEDVTWAEAIFCQGFAVVITKTMDECTLDGKTLTVSLMQEETLRLDAMKSGYVMVTVRTEDMRLRSQRVIFTAQESLKDEVI